MKTKLKQIGFFPLLIFTVFMLLFLASARPKYTFTGDTLSKLIQTQSLIKNNFQSEELYYPLRDIDPDYKFYPFQGVYLINNKGKHIGQYPVFFSFISALVLKLSGVLFLPFASIFITILTLFLFKKNWGVSNFILLFVSFCSFFIIHAVSYTEMMFYVFLVYCGMTLFLKGNAGKYAVFKAFSGGILMGMSVWLRLESMLFFGGLMLGGLIVDGFKTVIKERRYQVFVTGFSVAVIAFFIFNFIDYGHPLGPRYFTNVGVKEITFVKKIEIITTLLFGGGLRPGLFGYIPLFLVVIFIALRKSNYQKLTSEIKTLLIAVLSFLFVAVLVSPNDGSGRLGSAVFECDHLSSGDSSGFSAEKKIVCRKFFFLR